MRHQCLTDSQWLPVTRLSSKRGRCTVKKNGGLFQSVVHLPFGVGGSFKNKQINIYIYIYIYFRGSKPFWLIPFWWVGEFTHFRIPILVVGLVDVHWGYGILTHGHISAGWF